ncbi:hypothetical protein EXIGLDRAFT_746633 [Exidia glandulosa HHB12029]|uniref:DUF6533 domain-containing protein n=1 Tax=Exidia glandulosa HHB12029 TaxID=1314781 RepID=A0A165LW57_EXIGL|nr:hypothetical protein EXIGLDRAFT_746633 [Exidia glandulosa HHB12029]
MVAASATPTGQLQLACLSWFLYDWAISLGREVEYIVSGGCSISKSLYLFIRYLSLAMLLGETVVYVVLDEVSFPVCTRFTASRTAAVLVLVVAVEVAMQIRVFELYERSRRILGVNAALCVASLVPSVTLAVVYSPQAQFTIGDGACSGTSSSTFGVFLVAPILFASYLTAMTVRKTWRSALDGTSAITPFVPVMILVPLAEILVIILSSSTALRPGDSSLGLLHAACAISATRLLRNPSRARAYDDTTSVSDLPTASTAHFELSAVRHGAKDSYWSELAMLDSAVSPATTGFPPASEEATEKSRRRVSTRMSIIAAEAGIALGPNHGRTTPALAATIERQPSSLHLRTNSRPTVTALVTDAELDFEMELGDDGRSLNIVDGVGMKGLSPDASPREDNPLRNSYRRPPSMASLHALASEMSHTQEAAGRNTPASLV